MKISKEFNSFRIDAGVTNDTYETFDNTQWWENDEDQCIEGNGEQMPQWPLSS